MNNAITLALCLCLTACGLFHSEPPPIEEEEPASLHVGQIASVHTVQGFVLIRRSPGTTVPAGTILISQSLNGAAANLRVSGESLGQMIAADIQSGSPQVGDSVRESMVDEIEMGTDSSESDS